MRGNIPKANRQVLLYRCTIPVKKLDDNDVEHEQDVVIRLQ